MGMRSAAARQSSLTSSAAAPPSRADASVRADLAAGEAVGDADESAEGGGQRVDLGGDGTRAARKLLAMVDRLGMR
jgi:hypothetical protein